MTQNYIILGFSYFIYLKNTFATSVWYQGRFYLADTHRIKFSFLRTYPGGLALGMRIVFMIALR